MNQDESDELFITVRDGELAEAREALEKADMSWLHSTFRQNMLFLWSRRRRGRELLAKDCIRKGSTLRRSILNDRRRCSGQQPGVTCPW